MAESGGPVIGAPRTPRTFAFLGRRSVAAETAQDRSSSSSPSASEAPPSPIAATDAWARFVWKYDRSSPWVLLALPLWLIIRIIYRLTFVASVVLYWGSRPFVWAYWRLYEAFGPLARILKRVYWRLIYPPIGLALRALKKIYWLLCRVLYPLVRRLERAFWILLHPAIESAWRASKWLYWRALYPILDRPMRALGLGLPDQTKAQARADRAAKPNPGASLRAAFSSGLTEADAIAWIADTLEDFEPLFDCLPRFGLAAPAPAHLFIFCGPDLAKLSARQLRLLGLRLRSGAPCQRVSFYAPDAGTARKLEASFQARVGALHCHEAEFIEAVSARALREPPSLEVTRFGPVVLLISALWGRVGSTLIFDAQTQFLIENGAIVVRVFVDHNPRRGGDGAERTRRLVGENLTLTFPHFVLVASRDESAEHNREVRSRSDYREHSAVRRFELELEDAKASDAGLLAWAGAVARLTIVNHAMHMAFAERVSSAPIVLETHDVLTHQLDSHGWPRFISLEREPKRLREADQQAIWRRAKACVNLSPNDDAEISKCARLSFFIRPAAERAEAELRPWAEVAKANALSERFAAVEAMDILLWGDWHQGNARAVNWFLSEVVPLDPLLKNARIAVVGRVTQILAKKLLNAPNIVHAGFVDRLDDFFGRAKVLVIADQEGSGVSIKAVEAIRFGLPFVSTRIGLRGLELGGASPPACESAGAFAAETVRLLKDEKARETRAAQARALYAANISHDAYETQWRKVISSVSSFFSSPAETQPAPAALNDGPALLIRQLRTAAQDRVEPFEAPAPRAAPARRPRLPSHALSAVICTYNRYDLLPGAIDSLLGQDIAADDLDILVVDNSPDQAAAAEFAKTYSDTRVRYLLEPIAGLSNARNVGAEASNARFVAYIDDDAVAKPSWARELLAGFHKVGSKAGVAGGRILPRWLTPQPDWLPDELIGNLSIVDWGGAVRPLGKMEWIAGCNIAFERDTLVKLGGFSRALGRVGAGVALLSNEESAVIEKFADDGRMAIYVPDAEVEHLIDPGRLHQEWFRRRAAWQAVSDYIKDPKKAAAYAGAAAERLRRELRSDDALLPPGFVRPDAEREAFRRDVGLMYDIVIAMLAGGVELGEDGSPASLQDKLVANVRREVQRNPQLRAAIRKLANL